MKKIKTNFLKTTNKQKAPKKTRQGDGDRAYAFFPSCKISVPWPGLNPGQESTKAYPLGRQRIPRIQLLKQGSGQKLVRTDQALDGRSFNFMDLEHPYRFIVTY